MHLFGISFIKLCIMYLSTVNPLTRVKTNISRSFLVARVVVVWPTGWQVNWLCSMQMQSFLFAPSRHDANTIFSICTDPDRYKRNLFCLQRAGSMQTQSFLFVPYRVPSSPTYKKKCSLHVPFRYVYTGICIVCLCPVFCFSRQALTG